MKLRKTVITTIAIAVIGASIVSAPVKAANFEDYSTDAALCKEIGMQPLTESRSWRGWPLIEIPGVGTKTNFACGPSLNGNKPMAPSDGTRVDVNTSLGNVLIPCNFDESVDLFSGKQYAYVGLPNAAFVTAPYRTWENMKVVAEAEARSDYQGGNVYIANQVGTFDFVGQWTNPRSGETVKCNASVTVSEKASPTSATTTNPAASKQCVKAQTALAKAKKAKAPKRITAAKKAVAKSCR